MPQHPLPEEATSPPPATPPHLAIDNPVPAAAACSSKAAGTADESKPVTEVAKKDERKPAKKAKRKAPAQKRRLDLLPNTIVHITNNDSFKAQIIPLPRQGAAAVADKVDTDMELGEHSNAGVAGGE